MSANVNAEQLSRALNVTQRHVRRLVADGMPRATGGLYDLGQCLRWYIRHMQKILEHRGDAPHGSSMALASARLSQALAKSERLRAANLKARSEVLVASQVREQVNSAIGFLKQSLRPVAPSVTEDPELREKIREELRCAEVRFAQHLAKLRGPG